MRGDRKMDHVAQEITSFVLKTKTPLNSMAGEGWNNINRPERFSKTADWVSVLMNRY